MVNYPTNQTGYNQPQQPILYPYNNNLIYPYNNNLINETSQYNNSIRQQQPLNQYLKCRPVSSREEAMAFQIDLDGSLWVFPNVGNGKIYTKQINNDGTATFSTYSFTENENPYNSTNYVTKDEFNKVIQTIMAAIPSTQTEAGSAINNLENDAVKNSNLNF